MRYVIGSYTSSGGPGLALTESDRLAAAPDSPENPSWVVVGDQGVVYAVSESDPGTVSAWKLGDQGDWVRVGEPQWSGGSGPCHASLHVQDRYLVVANYGSGTVAALPVAPDGALSPPNKPLQLSGSGPVTGRQEASHAHQAITAPSGHWILVCDLGGDQVVTVALDPDSGSLEEHLANPFPAGTGPRHAVFVGELLVVVGELDGHAYICDWNSESGAITIKDRVNVASAGSEVDYPSAVVPSLTRHLVYIALRGSNSIVELDVEAGHVGRRVECGGDWPRSAILDPLDPSFMWVANERSGTITRVDLTGVNSAQEIWKCPGAADISVYKEGNESR